MSGLRISLVQANLFWLDAAANLRHFEALIAELEGDTDLVVLPEMFASGFCMEPRRCAEPMDGSCVAWMAAVAARYNVAVCGSLAIREGAAFYNRFVFMPPGGVFSAYDKRHLYTLSGEDRVYCRGHSRVVIPYRGWRICPQICYDLRFPAWCRNRGEYDLLVFVASWPDERRQHWRGLLRARAIENQCYVVGVNRIGEDGNGYRYVGDSAVCEYSGEPIVELGREPRIATVSLDLAAQAAYREKLPFLRDADDCTFAQGKD